MLSVSASVAVLETQVLTTHDGRKGMTDGFKEEKIVVDGDFDEHHHACGDDIEEGDYVDGSQNVEDDVSRTSQGFREARHVFDVVLLLANVYENEEMVVEIVRWYEREINDRK
ncbi:hypothetical protein EIK77_006960 [Talaromyces pinophilus]|nr:hypothetical protein EIK77_006960 [Talaromyces pinophilus]